MDRSRLFSAKEDKFCSISRKVHGTGVLGAEGILFNDYLERVNINRRISFQSLNRLDEEIMRKVPFCKKNIIFYQDNASAHKCVLSMEKLKDVHYEVL
jgi:hypothetical protein